jgi:hypothetical protein
MRTSVTISPRGIFMTGFLFGAVTGIWIAFLYGCLT